MKYIIRFKSERFLVVNQTEQEINETIKQLNNKEGVEVSYSPLDKK